MSSAFDPTHQSPITPPIAGQSFRPHYFVTPKKSLSDYINLRVLIFWLVATCMIGAFFLTWLREAINGGIIDHGTYYEVDLKAMSNFDLDQYNALPQDIPQKWRGLDGKRVELIGEMYAPGASDGALSSFQICFSRAKCCFNGVPLVQHFVTCHVEKGVTAYYDDGPVALFGTLHVRIFRDASKGGKIISIYDMDVTHQDIE
jgi:hypothetical protein